MAVMHGVPGEWARVKGMITGLWPLFLGVFAAGFSVALAFVSVVYAAIALFASIVYILWSLNKGLRHVERFFKGARGEEKVSEILKNLSEGYHVFNDFAVGSHHIDHVVIGPSGVFSVETKFWSGAVTVEDGHVLVDGRLPSRPPLKQALREAMMLRDRLAESGWTGRILPVLVFASDTFVARRADVGGVMVINAAEISESFSSTRTVLPQPDVERLAALMEAM